MKMSLIMKAQTVKLENSGSSPAAHRKWRRKAKKRINENQLNIARRLSSAERNGFSLMKELSMHRNGENKLGVPRRHRRKLVKIERSGV